MSILVTGGTGYIGSHTVVELLNSNEDVIIVDNLSNSSIYVLDNIKSITNKKPLFYKCDILDKDKLNYIFQNNNIEAVIHFAGLKAVGKSVDKPLSYYKNNISGTISLLEVMKQFECKKIVFSSSATVYGDPKTLPIKEDFTLSTTNPYGATKLFIEQILNDLYISDNSWSISILRYFNPIGAHESSLIGENPNGIPNNLMPYIMQVATKKLEKLNIFGNDYDTIDGTGVRDYIHVVDLSIGHIKALDYIRKNNKIETFNLGTGTGYSVLQIVENFEKASNLKINYSFAPRRKGDIAACYADPKKAFKILNWKATRDIEKMCIDSWNFISKNK